MWQEFHQKKNHENTLSFSEECNNSTIGKSIENTHPTLKPINLIKKIAELFILPDVCNQKWYVPFSGVGSERIGLMMAGIPLDQIHCCEINPNWNEINHIRTAHWKDKMNKS